jgi:hypothetical protein
LPSLARELGMLRPRGVLSSTPRFAASENPPGITGLQRNLFRTCTFCVPFPRKPAGNRATVDGVALDAALPGNLALAGSRSRVQHQAAIQQWLTPAVPRSRKASACDYAQIGLGDFGGTVPFLIHKTSECHCCPRVLVPDAFCRVAPLLYGTRQNPVLRRRVSFGLPGEPNIRVELSPPAG